MKKAAVDAAKVIQVESVILTGASGFIGKHCIAGLLADGYLVHAFYSNERPESSLPQKERLQWHQIDLLNQKHTSELLKSLRADKMLHLAWYTEPGKYRDSSLNWDWLRASVNLLKTFIESGGSRYVGAGSAAEYDWNSGDGKLKESSPLNASTLYGQCKSSLFQTAQQNSTLAGIEFAWGRIFWLYGPGENKQRLVPYVINSLIADKEAYCSEGKQQRDFLYVADVARAFNSLLNSKLQGAINIGSGKALSIKEIAETVARLMNREKLLQLGAMPSPNEPPLVVADNQRLKNELGFEAAYSLEDGLKLSLDWWRNCANLPPK